MAGFIIYNKQFMIFCCTYGWFSWGFISFDFFFFFSLLSLFNLVFFTWSIFSIKYCDRLINSNIVKGSNTCQLNWQNQLDELVRIIHHVMVWTLKLWSSNNYRNNIYASSLLQHVDPMILCWIHRLKER